MNPLLNGNGEIEFLTDGQKVVALDGLEQWQIDQLTTPNSGDSFGYAGACLATVDKVVTDWLKGLTKEQWEKINRQQSLFGIPLPDNWIKVWRAVLKEPTLRSAENAVRGGRGIGTFVHCWNLWAEECIEKYLDESEKFLLEMVDGGWLYSEIGEVMIEKYGEKFWKKRKKISKTTPSQVVNNYLYKKMPTKIVRGELADIVLRKLKSLENKNKK